MEKSGLARYDLSVDVFLFPFGLCILMFLPFYNTFSIWKAN